MCRGTDCDSRSPALMRGSLALADSMLVRMVDPFLIRFPCSSKSSLASLYQGQ